MGYVVSCDHIASNTAEGDAEGGALSVVVDVSCSAQGSGAARVALDALSLVAATSSALSAGMSCDAPGSATGAGNGATELSSLVRLDKSLRMERRAPPARASA
mmetsp:Transcript_21508/g.48586  ORF Transcript_21508/g.48586 Transcript_21508/m.48586 type:complete len:103 (+) Transcript_21508:256-564(+)